MSLAVQAAASSVFDNDSTSTCAGAQTNLTGLTINGATPATQNVTITGTSLSTGSGTTVSLGSTLSVTGAQTFIGNTDLRGTLFDSTGNLTIGDNVDLTGTLAITGAQTISGTLGVTGLTSTNGIANTGNIGTGTLSTTGLATLNSASVTNNATVGGTLGVTGQANLNGGANVSQNLTVAPASSVNMGGNRVRNVGTPLAPSDAATKAYVDGFLGQQTTELNNRINQAFQRIDENTEGIAVAMAMGGIALPNTKAFAISANLGFYDGKQAIGTQAAVRVNDTFALTGGFGAGLEEGKVGGRVGFMAAW
ncbi:MAG TPA: hypothetical protein VNJ31_05975 [Methyloceanibacter sp.]|nr:hypothetical protein [Methyloceanibacter sp.]